MSGDECLCLQWRNFVAIREHNKIVAPTFECPEIWFRGMLNVQVLQVDGVLVGKCVENTLK